MRQHCFTLCCLQICRRPEVNTAVGYRSQNMLTAHVGLGTNTRADSVIVRWPDGRRSVQTNVNASQVISIAEPLVSVDEKPALAISFSLEQNYPNPFNPTTKIGFQISEVRGQRSEASHVTLKVFDVLGREVATLVNEARSPGTYDVTWNAAGIGSGVFFYKLVSGSFTQTKKMQLLK